MASRSWTIRDRLVNEPQSAASVDFRCRAGSLGTVQIPLNLAVQKTLRGNETAN